jgi:hypothetical protein
LDVPISEGAMTCTTTTTVRLTYDFNLKNKEEKSGNVYSYTFLMSSMMNQRYNKWNHRGSAVRLNTFEDANVMLGQVVKSNTS